MNCCLHPLTALYSVPSNRLFLLGILVTFTTTKASATSNDTTIEPGPHLPDDNASLPASHDDILTVKCKHDMVPNYRTITCGVVDGRPKWMAGPEGRREFVSEITCVPRCPVLIPSQLEVPNMDLSYTAFLDRAAGESVSDFCDEGFKSFGSYICKETEGTAAAWEKGVEVQPQCKALCPSKVPRDIQVPHMNPSHDGFQNKAAGESVIQFCKQGFDSLGSYKCKEDNGVKARWEMDIEHKPHCKASSATAAHHEYLFLIILVISLPWTMESSHHAIHY